MQHTAAHCNTLLLTATCCYTLLYVLSKFISCLQALFRVTASRCNLALQHTAHNTACTQQHTCNTLTELNSCLQALSGVTASHCNATLQQTAAQCSKLQHNAAHCNTLQHTATHCSTLQRSAISLAYAQFAPRSSRRKSHLQSPVSLTHIHTPTHTFLLISCSCSRVCVCVHVRVCMWCVCVCVRIHRSCQSSMRA